jgi:hypothetical protein
MFEGYVQDGVIVPVEGSVLPPEGTIIKCETVHSAVTGAQDGSSLYDLLRDLITYDPDSPGDRSVHHDHYASGTPKR